VGGKPGGVFIVDLRLRVLAKLVIESGD
jgi:hypothetical protein